MENPTKYPRTKESLQKTMKVAQRELEDGRLKVDVLSSLVDLIEKLGGKDGRQPAST